MFFCLPSLQPLGNGQCSLQALLGYWLYLYIFEMLKIKTIFKRDKRGSRQSYKWKFLTSRCPSVRSISFQINTFPSHPLPPFTSTKHSSNSSYLYHSKEYQECSFRWGKHIPLILKQNIYYPRVFMNPVFIIFYKC